MRRGNLIGLGLLLFSGIAAAAEPPEVTEDGLVRVSSSRKVGVYRAPDVAFAHYQRVIIGPTIPIAFRKGWERAHPELDPQDIESIRADFARAFRTELERELVKRGKFAAAADPAPDVIRIDASVKDLDLVAPDAGKGPAQRTYARSAGKMTVTIELRDAASGVLIGRLIDFEQTREYQEPKLVNQVTNLEDFRIGFANAARYAREAINVAKTERPKP